MTNMKYLTYSIEEGIGVLTFNNPKAMNALNSEMLLELQTSLTELKSDPTLKVLILTGEGKAFIAGADIKEMHHMDSSQAEEFSLLGNGVFRMLETFPVSVIAAVNGFALGGGLELALSTDYIFASKNAKMGLPELTLGLIPGFGGCKRLADRIGLAKAKELIYSGRMLTAEEALQWGIVNRVTEPGELLDLVKANAREILGVSPHAVREAKELLSLSQDLSHKEMVSVESRKFSALFSHPESKIGMKAFLEKVKPIWKDPQ